MSNTEHLTAEFNPEPSPLSQCLVDSVLALNAASEKQLAPRSLTGRLRADFRAKMYVKSGWREYYEMLRSYTVPEFAGTTCEQFDLLHKEFERFYKLLIDHNLILGRIYTAGAEHQQDVETEEDRKTFALLHFTPKQFKEQFGQYALENFELSERRFSEYTDTEIKQLSGLAKNSKTFNKTPLEEAAKKTEADISLLIALRELAKSKTLLIIAGMRKTAKATKHKDVFSLKKEELMKLCQK